MILIVVVLSDAGTDGWMMRHLLSEVPVIFTNQFECLAQDRIEGLIESLICTLVLGNTESGNIQDPNDWVLLLVSFVEQVLVLHDLCHLLHHTDWLIEIDRHAESG